MLLASKKLLRVAAAGYKTIEYVGGKSGLQTFSNPLSVDLTTGLTGGIASGVSNGDYVVYVGVKPLTSDGAYGTYGPDDGSTIYSTIADLYANDNQDTNLFIGGKVVSGDTSLRSYLGGGGFGGAYAIKVFRNVDQTTPLDVTTVTTTGTNQSTTTPPAITPATPGAWILCVGACGVTGTSGSYSAPSDLEQFVSNGEDDGSSRYCAYGFGYKDDWASGAFTPSTWSYSLATAVTHSWAAATFALRPALL